MKAFKRIIGALLIFLAVMTAMIAVCILDPDAAKKLNQLLYHEESVMQETVQPSESEEDENAEDTESVEETEPFMGVTPLPTASAKESESVETETKETTERSDLQPVEGKTEEISEKQAEALKSELPVGETGENLSFDETIYPYYSFLNDRGKAVYKQICANANALNKSFAPINDIGVSELDTAFMAVCNDHPELFFMDTRYACKSIRGGKVIEMTLQFNQTAEHLQEEKAAFDAAAGALLQSVTDGEPVACEQQIYRALMDHAEYNLRAPLGQSAYSALVNGSSVCAGYARAFQYLMQKAGIPCYFCTGYSRGDHAWNIVKLGENYYNADATWDDTKMGAYDYFNRSDAEFAKDHRRTELSVYLPACKAPVN